MSQFAVITRRLWRVPSPLLTIYNFKHKLFLIKTLHVPSFYAIKTDSEKETHTSVIAVINFLQLQT